MKVRYNEDSAHVSEIKEALAANEGYCPCRIERTDDTLCMCREFREQLKDPSFEGLCHCGLFYKEK